MKVFIRAPILTLALFAAVFSARLGAETAAGLFVLGFFYLVITYVLGSIPAVAAWLAVFWLARRLGLKQSGASALAAPVMGLAASLVLCTLLSFDMEFRIDIFLNWLSVIAPLAMIVAFLVAVLAKDEGDRLLGLDRR